MRILPCTVERLGDVLDLCREEYELSTLTFIPFDEHRVLELAQHCMVIPEYFCRLAYNDEQCVGLIAGYVTPALWSTRKIAHQMMWFVREHVPERGKAAKLLMESFEQWGREKHDCAAVMSGVQVNIDNLGADIMHRRLGFVRSGTLYIKQLEG